MSTPPSPTAFGLAKGQSRNGGYRLSTLYPDEYSRVMKEILHIELIERVISIR